MAGTTGKQQQLLEQQQPLTVRRHGCHLPFAPLQLLSWALLLALAAGFYALVIPLFPADADRALAAVYGVLLALTFGLALTTTCIDPADPRVKAAQQRAKRPDKAAAAASAAASAGTSASVGEEEDRDRAMDGSQQRRGVLTSMDGGADIYCYICRVDVAEASAHCRHCRKCCLGFDHHCAWLNTCIGRSNYAPFLGTVGAALALLGLHTAAAAVLLARFGLEQEAFVDQAIAALPSLPPTASAALLALSLAATAPLLLLVAQLLLFHLMLKAQGLTTYQYVLRETKCRTVRAEAAAARRHHRQQLLSAATAAVRTMGGTKEDVGAGATPPLAASQRVVVMSPPSRSSRAAQQGGGRASSWWSWPWGRHRRQPSVSLPGDEFLVAHRPDDEPASSMSMSMMSPAV